MANIHSNVGNKTYRVLRYVLLIVGIIVGLAHLKMGARAWFVARNDEPPAFWLFIWAGPLSTLPASITAFIKAKVGGWWLICCAALSYVGWMGAMGIKGDTENAIWFLTRWSFPMMLLGLAFLFVEKYNQLERR